MSNSDNPSVFDIYTTPLPLISAVVLSFQVSKASNEIARNLGAAFCKIYEQVQFCRRVAVKQTFRRRLERMIDRCEFAYVLGPQPDVDTSTILRITLTSDVTALLQPIDQARDGSGGQASMPRQIACGGTTA
ncbi:DNA-directed DNA polymerase III alpha subunit [Sphingopyxis sp. 113P3]|nr:DNA-directed DNA polymerase III alpha subunit [Sphingopyxis sp. 113P3]